MSERPRAPDSTVDVAIGRSEPPSADLARERVLLEAARDAIEAAVLGRAAKRSHEESLAALQQPGASFVTLRKADGSLRGCIGELEAQRPLIESIRYCAVGAALRDPRFPPVSPDELRELLLGISVLTPARLIAGPHEIEIGTHGVLIERGHHRGVLLPEVALEQAWDAETFLAYTCRKAGLAIDAWREPGTQIRVFTTVKIAE